MADLTAKGRAIDAQSQVAFADLVVSAAGTVNREAVALGTPVYTIFEGKLGAVDDGLIADGRPKRLSGAAEVALLGRTDTAPSGFGGTPPCSRICC